MRKIVSILFYFGFPLIIFSQGITKIDSLKKVLQTQLVDTTTVSTQLKIANLYSKSNKDSAIYYYNKALKLAKEIDSKPQISELLYRIGIYHERNSNYEKAIKNYKASFLIFETLDNKIKLVSLYNDIGYNYAQLYSEDRAIEYYLKSLSLSKQLSYNEGIAYNYTSIGNLYYVEGNYELAKKYFLDALFIYEKLNDKPGISACYTNIGNVLADSNNVEEGLDYYEKSIILQKELDDQYGIAINYNNIGDCYLNLKEYTKAEDYFFKALEIANKTDEKDLKSIVFLNIADVKNKQKKYSEAIVAARKSYAIAHEIGNLDYEAQNIFNAAIAYEGMGDNALALSRLKDYVRIKDSLLDMDKVKKIKLFNALNNLEKSQFIIDDLSKTNEIAELKYINERKFSYFLIGAMVISGFFIILLILQQTSKKKAYKLLEFKNHQINKLNIEIQTQSDSLKQLNKTKDKLFSIIAHDLRNPFNSIKGFTELLIENFKDYDEEKLLKFLKIIKGSSLKALNLLNNLLLWANNQSGNLNVTTKKIELINEVVDSISVIEIQAINKDIEIINTVENHLFVEADENMLATILRNLISNAIKFTEPKGKVELSAKVIDNFVEVTVKDTGVGISQSDIENLFSIDAQNSSVGTANEKGSGLGLILCKDFVENLGGKIWVQSVVAMGTEFKFTLPIAKS